MYSVFVLEGLIIAPFVIMSNLAIVATVAVCGLIIYYEFDRCTNEL